MIGAKIKSINWAEKVTIPRDVVFITLICVALVLTFFKLKPYFDESPKIVTYSQGSGGSKTDSFEKEAYKFVTRGLYSSTTGSHSSSGIRGGNSSGYGGNQKQRRIIERALFDNMAVTAQAVLVRGLSSYQSDLTVEARIAQATAQDGYDLDLSFLQGATLSGVASMNMKLKRVSFTFNTLVTADGSRYPVTGIAFDPATSNLGVAANYASGIPSRMLGMAIGKAIQLGDEVAMSRVLQNNSGDDFVTRELNRALSDANQQASGSVSQQVTKDLNETEAELTLGPGTPIFIKLKGKESGGGQ